MASQFFKNILKTIRMYRRSNIIIYQMGKVGSTAIAEAIPGAYHFHSLYGNVSCPIIKKIKRIGIWGRVGKFLKLAVRRFVFRHGGALKVITVIRDPVDRNVSMFFNDLYYWLSQHVIDNCIDNRDDDRSSLVDAYVETFDHGYYERWFDKELKRFTGIDVLSVNFDTELGYAVFRGKNCSILLLRYESLSVMGPILSDFVGSTVVLSRRNVGARKWYAGLYADFKRDRNWLENLSCSIHSRGGSIAQNFEYTHAPKAK